jgi:hypothetical protein
MKNNNITYSYTFYSSLLFLTNVTVNYYLQYYLYSFLFFLLTLTSLIHHSNNTYSTYILDQISIISVVLYGLFVFCKKINKKKYLNLFLILILFLSTIYLYHYGYNIEYYCFSKDKNIADLYHVLMHFISSIGHHLIVFM